MSDIAQSLEQWTGNPIINGSDLEKMAALDAVCKPASRQYTRQSLKLITVDNIKDYNVVGHCMSTLL